MSYCPGQHNCKQNCDGNLYDCKTARVMIHRLAESIGLPARQATILYRAGYKTPEQVRFSPMSDMMAIREFGPKSIKAVQEFRATTDEGEDS